MRRILLLTLDLKGPSGSYAPLYEAIKRQGSWWHYLNWTWLLQTVNSPDQIVAELSPHLQTADRLFVTPVTRPYQGWLPKDAWAWINERAGDIR